MQKKIVKNLNAIRRIYSLKKLDFNFSQIHDLMWLQYAPATTSNNENLMTDGEFFVKVDLFYWYELISFGLMSMSVKKYL